MVKVKFNSYKVHVILCEFNVDPCNVGRGLGLVGMCKPIGSIYINANWIEYYFP